MSQIANLAPIGSSPAGDLVGPASATDNAIALFDGTTGKLVKSGPVTLVQAVQSVLNTTGSTTANIPRDTTPPQNTEGAEWDTLAIIPSSATNILRFTFLSNVEHAGSGAALHIVCLFQDSTADALQSNCLIMTDAGDPNIGTLHLEYSMLAGTTSSTTFKIRYGNNGGGAYTTYMNRRSASSTALFGTAGNTVFTIEELAV